MEESASANLVSNRITMEDWTSASDHIIVAERIGAERYENGSPKYSVIVEKELKGKLQKNQIDVYALQGLPQEYSRYVLFLYASDSEYYDEGTYSVVHSANALDGNNVKTGPYKGLDLNELLQDIHKSPGLKKVDTTKHIVVEQPESMEKLIEASDYIVHFMPNEVRFENDVIRDYVVEYIRVYKGDERIQARESLTLPNEVEPKEEYLVFYQLRDKNDNTDITLTTRKGSVISKSDTNAWEEAISLLEQLQR